jgi:DNA-binding NarL/FixJ family response regulator
VGRPKLPGGSPPTDRLRRWIQDKPFRRPSGLRVEESLDDGNTLVVSFRVPEPNWQTLLTGTETEIARDVLAGLSNAEISRKRGTAVRTIANQIASIYRKLQVRSRLELSLYALAGQHPFESKSRD